MRRPQQRDILYGDMERYKKLKPWLSLVLLPLNKPNQPKERKLQKASKP